MCEFLQSRNGCARSSLLSYLLVLKMYYKLVLKNEVDGLKGRVWSFRAPATLGREPGSEICINHYSISRQHCSFTLNGDEALVVKDLGSTNGIYVDDNKVDHRVLMPNQVLQVGALQLQVQFSSEDEVRSGQLQPLPGSLDKTRAMPVINFDPPADEKSWWQKLFG